MPRPIKCRKVCHFPDILEFRPSNENGGRGEEDEKEVILLTVDEYETIRLIDKEGYSQEQCAGFMQIARTTVQRIYEIARKKVADAIIDGHPLRIEGGDFQICDGKSSKCGLGGCYKQEFYQKYATEKGESIMRVAVTYENGQIFQHFGHTAEFKVYDVQDGKVIHSEVVDTNGSGHGALAVPDEEDIVNAALSIKLDTWGLIIISKDGQIKVLQTADKLPAIMRDKTLNHLILKLL